MERTVINRSNTAPCQDVTKHTDAGHIMNGSSGLPHLRQDCSTIDGQLKGKQRSQITSQTQRNKTKALGRTQNSRPHTFSDYLIALRPWSFSASLTPVLLGSCLAYRVIGTFNIYIFLATCLTALSVHAAGNLVNTYFDYIKGVDNVRSDDRTLVDHVLSPNDVASMGAASYCMGCVGFIILVYLSPTPMEHLALIYFGGLSGSFLYTGGLGLKYIALGDVVILLTFGPVTVLFAFMSQGGPLCWTPLLYAIPLSLNIEAILHSNNTRDMDSDRESGIYTLAIMLGHTGSYLLFAFLMFMPYLLFGIMALNKTKLFLLPFMTVFEAFQLERSFRKKELCSLPHQIAKLNLLLGILYVIACFLADLDHLPGF